MKIDLVIPWVCEDEQFQQERNKYLNDTTNEQATIKVRFKDNGELKYLLRSVEENASFINNIFLVTNGQIPNWLNLKHPKIHIINHKEIFPADALPTFNTLAIEACIVNIPNLSNHFLYSNDDMFFANKVTENFFFDKNGYPIIRFRKNFHPENKLVGLYDIFIKNSLDKFSEKFKIDLPYHENHNIDPYYKPDVIACIKEFEEDFQKTIYSRFRSKDNMRRIVWSCYSFYIGHSKIRFYYLYKISNKFRGIIKFFYNIFRDSRVMSITRKKYNVKHNSHIKLFCLNDNENATDNDRIRAVKFLENYFPKKSSFEL